MKLARFYGSNHSNKVLLPLVTALLVTLSSVGSVYAQELNNAENQPNSADVTGSTSDPASPTDEAPSESTVNHKLAVLPATPTEAVDVAETAAKNVDSDQNAQKPKEVKAVAAKAVATPKTKGDEEDLAWYDMIKLSPWISTRLTIGIQDLGDLSPSINSAGFTVTADYGPFEMVLTPEIRQTKNRDFFPSNIVLKEGYIKWNTPVDGLSVSGGLIYNQFGLFWDDSFFGNNAVYLGRKLNADYNLQVAWQHPFTSWFGLQGWLQLSPGTDGTDLSLPQFHTTGLKTADDFEINKNFKTTLAGRLRVIPVFLFGDFALKPGVSLEYKRVERKDIKANSIVGPNNKPLPVADLPKASGGVFSAALDLSLYWNNLRWTTEFIGQFTSRSLSYTDENINRFHISNSLHAPVYEDDSSEWFSNVYLNGGFAYSLYKTEEFNEIFIYAGATTQIYDHFSFQMEYGRFWVPGAAKANIDQLELLFNANF